MSLVPGRTAASGARARHSGHVRAAIVFALSSALAACGGGGGGSSPPPAITIASQPADIHVADGMNAAFTVGVSGSATYDWQRLQGGVWTDVPGGTDATLSLGAAHATDSGAQYHVIVASSPNAANRVTSSTVTLTVDPAAIAPSIATQPVAAAVQEHQDAAFSVTAAGTSLVYRWQLSADGSSWRDTGGTLSTYTWQATLADDGDYVRVVVSNALGLATSKVVRLAVAPAPSAPSITSSPAAAGVVAGEPATFNVTAVGTPAPTIVWYRSADLTTWIAIAGATGGSYTIAATTMADTGHWFKAVATNESGSADSGPARLDVDPAPAAPAITRQPVDFTAQAHGSALFQATANGVPAPAFQWQLSADGGATFMNINGATGADYGLSDLALADDQKRFRVIVTNTHGSVTSNAALLRVFDLPHITSFPFSSTWHPGREEAYFLVQATGGSLSYQWKTSTDNGASFTDVPGATGPGYALPASAPAATGEVCVTVANPIGSVQNCASVDALDWDFVAPQPTADALAGLAWLDVDTAFAGGDNGTILRSLDGGTTWAIVSESGPFEARLRGIAFVGRAGVAVGEQGRVKRTIDGGAHWSPVWTPDNIDWNGLATTPAGLAVAVGRAGHVRVSRDVGATWQDASTDANTHDLRAVAFNHLGIGLAMGDSGTVARSADGGANWAATTIAGAALTDFTTVAFATDGVAVAATSTGQMWRTTDAGLSWNPVASSTVYAIWSVQFADAQVGIATTVQGPFVRTVDGGVSWAPIGTDAQHSFLAVRFIDAVTALATGTDGQILRSTDAGQTWTRLTPASLGSFAGIAFASPTVGIAVGSNALILRTTDAGATWAARTSPLVQPLQAAAFANSSVGLIVGGGGAILRTTDSGVNWTAIASGTSAQINTVAFASPAIVVAGTSTGLLRSTDAGLTWVPVSGITEWVAGIAFGNSQTGVTVTPGGRIYRTTDGGATWSVAATLGGPQPDLRAVAFASPTVATAVGDIGQIMMTTDGGATWRSNAYWRGYGLSAVAFSSVSNGVVTGAYNGVILRTTDGGLTWQEDAGGKSLYFTGVAVASGQAIVAVDRDGSIFRTTRF